MKDHEIRELVNQLRDVAIKYHGTGQLREQIARTVRVAILQAQSDDDGEPTDDERIMTIEGIHNCERCGDEGWVVDEMGITRCACGRAGNSPANPGCWCRTCRPVAINDMRFVVCPDCGNKRCPRANDHRNACTGSNEPGQEGSAYPSAPQEAINALIPLVSRNEQEVK